jgi:hypothetical protein
LDWIANLTLQLVMAARHHPEAASCRSIGGAEYAGPTKRAAAMEIGALAASPFGNVRKRHVVQTFAVIGCHRQGRLDELSMGVRGQKETAAAKKGR